MMMFDKLMREDQDFVRMHSMEACLIAAKTLGTPVRKTPINRTRLNISFLLKKCLQAILGYIGTLSEDSSWRVKYTVCEHISQVQYPVFSF
jgi:hypothetical protein